MTLSPTECSWCWLDSASVCSKLCLWDGGIPIFFKWIYLYMISRKYGIYDKLLLHVFVLDCYKFQWSRYYRVPLYLPYIPITSPLIPSPHGLVGNFHIIGPFMGCLILGWWDSLYCFYCGFVFWKRHDIPSWFSFKEAIQLPLQVVAYLGLRFVNRSRQVWPNEGFNGLVVCFIHRIGWWEHLQETPIFDGKNHAFL